MPLGKEPFCTDCARSLSATEEYAYVLKDQVWEESVKRAIEVHTRKRRAALQESTGAAFSKPVPTTKDLCCITCVEERLGRTLTISDFNWGVFLNTTYEHRRSPLLMKRMKARA